MRLSVSLLGILSWFTGGVLLGLVEIVQLPKDPLYSVLLQLSPLLFLAGGISVVILQYQQLGMRRSQSASTLRKIMDGGWIAVFGINAGLASLNNFSIVIFQLKQLPYYFQGVSLAQKIIALAGIFVLGTASILASREAPHNSEPMVQAQADFWEKPLTNIGFIAILAGLVLGLAQYWSPVVYAGFFMLLAGAMMYLIGRWTEKDFDAPEKDPSTGP